MGLSSAILGWLPVLAAGLRETPLAGRALPECEQPGFALFQQGSSCHLFGVEKHLGADTKPSSCCNQRDHYTCGHSNSAHLVQAIKSQPHPVWPRAFQPQQLPSTWLVPGCDPGALDTYPGNWSWDAALARSTRCTLRGSISKA